MRIAITVAVLIYSTIVCWGQEYYEASGQTVVFTLAAGAKAGSSAIIDGQAPRSVPDAGISVTTARGGIVVMLPGLQQGRADIAIYNIAGQQIYRQRGFSGKTLRLESWSYKPGIYAVRVCVDGKIYARRVAVTGQGK